MRAIYYDRQGAAEDVLVLEVEHVDDRELARDEHVVGRRGGRLALLAGLLLEVAQDADPADPPDLLDEALPGAVVDDDHLVGDAVGVGEDCPQAVERRPRLIGKLR